MFQDNKIYEAKNPRDRDKSISQIPLSTSSGAAMF